MGIYMRYNMAFTSCALSLFETCRLASVYADLRDWDNVRQYAVQHNVLQYRTESSLKRNVREIISRLQCLSSKELSLLSEGDIQEQKCLVWKAICLTYPFIREFCVEVIQEKRLTLDLKLLQSDFDAFFNAKANIHENLVKITSNTRKKLKQVLFKMLRDVGIIDDQDYILPFYISDRIRALFEGNAQNLAIFPN